MRYAVARFFNFFVFASLAVVSQTQPLISQKSKLICLQHLLDAVLTTKANTHAKKNNLIPTTD